MSLKYCLYCMNVHDHYEWKMKRWPVYGGDIDGWVCGIHTRVSYPEFVTDDIKDQRLKYFNSALQPYRDGVLSKEYLEAHGTRGINPSQSEISKAKYTWKDLRGWNNRKKSM